MNEDANAQKFFLGGIAVLGILIVAGLVWAVLSPSSAPGSNGSVDTNLHFTDDNDPAVGPADAKVTVRVFGDFQCPACGAAEPGFDYVRKTYGDKVRFVWDDFPLTELHPNAMVSANAARCAEEQGKFWEYHDRLYAAQNDWANLADPKPKLIAYAQGLGLDSTKFSACLSAQTYAGKIQADMNEGSSNNVDATPTFFVNNAREVGSLQTDQWDQVIQASLKNAGQ